MLFVNLLIFHVLIRYFPFYINSKIKLQMLRLVNVGEMYFEILMHKHKRHEKLPTFSSESTHSDGLHEGSLLSNILRIF